MLLINKRLYTSSRYSLAQLIVLSTEKKIKVIEMKIYLLINVFIFVYNYWQTISSPILAEHWILKKTVLRQYSICVSIQYWQSTGFLKQPVLPQYYICVPSAICLSQYCASTLFFCTVGNFCLGNYKN